MDPGHAPVAAVADDTYDQMMTDVTKIVDRTEYMNKLHEIETYLVEEQVYVIPLFDFNEPALKKENLKGVYMTPGDVRSTLTDILNRRLKNGHGKLKISDLLDYKFLSGIVASPSGKKAAFLQGRPIGKEQL